MSLPNTHFGTEKIAGIMEKSHNIFFAGIGGVSMCSLAEISLLNGYKVKGYDRSPSKITSDLEQKGIEISYTADEKNVYDCDVLVYTIAMPDDTPEYVYCMANNIPCISRADYLGYLMSAYTNRIGVSGTHGKSTTTGMIASVLSSASVEPTVLNGAMMKESGSYNIIGKKDYFAFEACEYKDSFLDFSPTAAIVLNVELDHVDYFPDIDAIKNSFAKFIGLTGKNGLAVINFNDDNAVDMSCGYEGRLVSYSDESPLADYFAENVTFNHGRACFDIMYHGEKLTSVSLKIPGRHNVSNAVGTAAVCHSLGIDAESIKEGLDSYVGIDRRMDLVAQTKSGCDVYTDYAHHPTEIAATLSGAVQLGYDHVRVIFQSHTFSRTYELFDDFAKAFSESGIDELVLTDIYPARETNIYGVTSEQLSEKIAESGLKCSVIHKNPDAGDYMNEVSGSNDCIIVMGAGDVIQAAERIKAINK